jgi:hypothetical protein
MQRRTQRPELGWIEGRNIHIECQWAGTVAELGG